MKYIAFIIVLLHWTAIVVGYIGQSGGDPMFQALFYGSFLHLSPILLVFNVIGWLGADWHGRFSRLVVLGLVLAVVKYGSLILAIRREGFEGLNMITVAMEAIYIAASGYDLFKLNII